MNRSLKSALSLTIFAVVVSAQANPVTASRVIKIINAVGKTSVAFATSAVAGVVAAKVMKDFEHAHDDAPGLHVIAYYTMIGNRKVDEASTFWIAPPERHLQFMKTFERLELVDLREISKTPEKAVVWVALEGNQVSRPAGRWQGTVHLQWNGKSWVIASTEIKQRNAA